MPSAMFIKRMFDVVATTGVLIAGLPIMAVIAILIKRTDSGPVTFKQTRMGKDFKPFSIYKFRTMAVKKEGNETLVWTAEEEARVTRIGHFLRDYGLDELPQILNILKGDMSIIGPRPPMTLQVDSFTDRQKKMFKMRPGVLSLAAIKGRRSISMEDRYELHVHYVENWSLALDWAIFWKTAWVVITGQDARERMQTQP